MRNAICAIDGCGRRVLARNWCSSHYSQWFRTGDPLGTLRPSIETRFWSKVAQGAPDDCWEWLASRNKAGYGKFGAGGKTDGWIGAHRQAWLFAHPDETLAPGQFVCHRCDNPPCCNPAHLFAGTCADNVADMVGKDRHVTGPRPGARVRRGDEHWTRLNPERLPHGEAHHQAKITDRQVSEIRVRYAKGGITQLALAAEYGVARSYISRIVNGLKRPQ